MSVVKNKEELEQAHKKVVGHYLCFDLEEFKTHYVCVFPYAINLVDGIRIAKSGSKAATLQKLFLKLEQIDRQSSLFNQ